MRSFKRADRLADQISRDLSAIVQLMFQDSGGLMATISGVELSPDLRRARIFYTALGGEAQHEAVGKLLERSTGRIQSELAHRLQARRVPEISFHLDKSLEQGMRILSLMDKLKTEQDGQQS